ncbi:MAG: SGNH/GDSL hydrolase family protein [Clostridia bacterium]|nr:SGNH/GDSL hydrolase family protein [Clostridia bacterium]
MRKFLLMIGCLVILLNTACVNQQEPITGVPSSVITTTTPAQQNIHPFSAKADTLVSGDRLTLQQTYIKRNKEFSFSATVENFDTLYFRRGTTGYANGYVAIDNTKIEVYTYTDTQRQVCSAEHGLSITGHLQVTMSVNSREYLTVHIQNDTASYTTEEIPWGVCRGDIVIESQNSKLTNVSANWSAADLTAEIWILGDSYLSTLSNLRWPYHVLSAGYDACLYSGYPGATSSAMIKEWKHLLEYETPQYAVWCLGMNDPDQVDEFNINPSWQTAVKSFIKECETRNITPVLTTIPNTPDRNHVYKNEYVRNSGYRYIDFAAAVNATDKGSSWSDGMLSPDRVHPAAAGAQALAQQVLHDFPEITDP